MKTLLLFLQMNVSTPAPIPVQVITPSAPANAVQPVQVVMPLPVLTTIQLKNQLLYRTAMAPYCRFNLCAPSVAHVVLGGGNQ